MDIKLPLLLNMLKDLIDIDFNDNMSSVEKETELKDKIRKNEAKLKNKVFELNGEREMLQDKLEDIESIIINIEYLVDWAKS